MFAVIFIPNFSLQSALRHEPELRARAVALIDPALPKPAIVQVTSAARGFGIGEGLTASQAMARCGDLIIRSRSVAQDNSATEILLQTAYAFSSNIESTAPGVCTMELKGLGLNGDFPQRDWAGEILQTLKQFYLEAKIGIARTPELALLAAHRAERISIMENRDEYIIPLPVAALNPSPEISEILSRWGIRTVGEFLTLGKNDVAERLGVAAMELFDRVSSNSVRPLKLISPPVQFAEEMEFENEIETTEPLLFAVRRFVEQLSRRLELIYLVVAELNLQLALASGKKYERIFRIPSPTGNVATLFRMLQTHLENVRTDSPIVSLRLIAVPTRPETHQVGLFESTLRDPNQFAETLARLTALLGGKNVGTPQPISTHKPDSFRMIIPEFDRIEMGSARVSRAVFGVPSRTSHYQFSANEQTVERTFGRDARTDTRDACATLRRFRPPLPAHFEFRDKKPVLIRSEMFSGAVVKTRGPFFSSGDWWDDNRWAREEWDVETSDGSLLRIFHSDSADFVEGVYD